MKGVKNRCMHDPRKAWDLSVAAKVVKLKHRAQPIGGEWEPQECVWEVRPTHVRHSVGYRLWIYHGERGSMHFEILFQWITKFNHEF